MKKKSTLVKKLASYSGLVSAVLLAAKSSDGQILYTDIDPDDVTTSTGSTTLDLNNDGTTDFTFNVFQSGVFAVVRVVGEGSNSITRDVSLNYYAGYYYANALMLGDIIDAGQSFKNQEILGSASTSNDYGNFPGITAFMGLKVVVSSNTYYGWAAAKVNPMCTELTLFDYAMDTVAGEAIAAGDKCGNFSALVNTQIFAPDPPGFCEGSNTVLSVDSLNAESFQWLLDGNVIDSATSNSVEVDTGGNYSVVITTDIGCVDTSNAVTVSEFPLPDPPIVSQTENTLSTEEAIAYQWYHEGDLIAGATNQDYDPDQGGDYIVVITDANGCTSESAPFTFIPVGISNTEMLSLSVTESNNIIYVQLFDEKLVGATMKIFNSIGDEMNMITLTNQMQQFDLNHLSKGMYVVVIKKELQTFSSKVVVQ